MTNYEKAKAYDEALERARKIHSEIVNNEIIGFPGQIETIFPELLESEDERIRKELVNFLQSPFIKENLTDEKVAPWLAWLEKQKEPTTEELYAEAGTTEKEYIANTMKMVRAMREKQKEQKPVVTHGETYHVDTLGTQQVIAGKMPQKPAWSEKDADMLNCCISSIEEAKENRYAYKETDGDTSYDREIDWLKSLRPSWKPSEEQMEAFRIYLYNPQYIDNSEDIKIKLVESLYNDLKKLM